MSNPTFVVSSFPRSGVRAQSSSWRAASTLAWSATVVVLATAAFLVIRACSYDARPLAVYAAYFVGHIFVPGLVAVSWVNRRALSLTAAVALGVPTGFALEVFTYLGLAALGTKPLLEFVPLAWVAAGGLLGWRRREGPLRWRVTPRHAGLALGLAVLFLATVFSAASHMFAESPLVAGLPQRPIFHDWMYLVSRAAALKTQWPLEDPSLAGVPLQYHYFMLVHVAAASWVTGLELTQVLLRLSVLPLGAVLVVQAYALGRAVSRRAWGGVLAALLTVAAGELAFTVNPNGSVFLGRFVRWLFVSPTFYFGMIFFGALFLVIEQWRSRRAADFRVLGWLALLAAAATGAKGTVMPVVLVSLAGWAVWRWVVGRRFPTRLVIAGACAGVMFIVVYRLALAGWGTGAAAFVPLDIFGVSEFWRQHAAGWSGWLGHRLPSSAATSLAGSACAAVVVLGTLGVRALALPFLLSRHAPAHQPLVEGLGAACVSSLAMGAFMRLDADGELYVFLLVQLPAAVLAAGLLVRVVETCTRAAGEPAGARRTGVNPGERASARPEWWSRPSVGIGAVAVIGAVVLVVQVGVFIRRNAQGYREWRESARFAKPLEGMELLTEALLWVRKNTEREAVLVANAFTPDNVKNDHWAALDGTLVGVHYYYSALSERRLLVEGPNYLLDPVRVRERMDLAAQVFYGKKPHAADTLNLGPVYLLLDRSVRDGAAVELPPTDRVFSNSRIEIFRLPGGPPPVKAAALTR